MPCFCLSSISFLGLTLAEPLLCVKGNGCEKRRQGGGGGEGQLFQLVSVSRVSEALEVLVSS